MNTPPLTDLAQRVADRLTRLHADQETWRQPVTNAAAALPPQRCDIHPDNIRGLDVQESVRLSLKVQRPTLCWQACDQCAAEQDRQTSWDRQRHRGVPESCIGMTLETWLTDWHAEGKERRSLALAKARRYADEHKTGAASRSTFLFMLGKEPGTGKTSLAVATANSINGSFWVQEFAALVELARKGEADDRLYILQRSRVLVLDEFGARQIGRRDEAGGNSLELDTMSTLLHYRYERGLPTVITGNLSSAEIRGRLDGRTLDRVNGSKTTIDFSGLPSRRTAP